MPEITQHGKLCATQFDQMSEVELEGVITLISKYIRAVVQQTKLPQDEFDSELLQENVTKLKNLLQRLPSFTHEAPEEVRLTNATWELLGTCLKLLMAKKTGSIVANEADLVQKLEIFRNSFAVWAKFSRSYNEQRSREQKHQKKKNLEVLNKIFDIPTDASDVRTVKEGDFSAITYTLPENSPALVDVPEHSVPTSSTGKRYTDGRDQTELKRSQYQRSASATIVRPKINSSSNYTRPFPAHENKTKETKSTASQLSPEADKQLDSILQVSKPASINSSGKNPPEMKTQKLSQQAEAELESIIALANQPKKSIKDTKASLQASVEFDNILSLLVQH